MSFDYDDQPPYEVYEITNPYPLGVPTRVTKEYEADWAEMHESTDPVFHIDCERMTGRDANDVRCRVDAFLASHDVNEDLIDILIDNVGKAFDKPRLKWIEVGWNYELGWHIKVAREVNA